MLNRKSIIRLGMILALIISTFTPIQAKKSKVEELLDHMTLRQKITQTFLMDFTSWNGTALTTMNDEFYSVLEDYDFGGIILFASNIENTEDTYNLTSAMQEAATSDHGIPMIIATDQEGGTVARLGSATTLAGNMAIGATDSTDCAKQTGEIIGNELAAVGINTTLAPVVDVNNNANNPVIGLRSYSDDPELVGEMASSFIEGLEEYNIIGCAKHFPGHGNTSTDSHYGLPMVERSYEELTETELAPYETVIDQGVDMIMTAHILYPELDDSTIYSNKTGQEESRPATLSYEIVTKLLKGKMGFNGVVCSDALNMSGITNTFDESQAVVEALVAGIDLICMPASGISNISEMQRVDQIIQAVEDAIDDGYLSEERLDDAVTRILTLKENRGILDYNENSYSLEEAKSIVGSKENQETAEEIACKAITVITNENNTLPVKVEENEKVLFVYPYASQKEEMEAGWEKAKEAGLIPESAQMECYQYYRTNYEIIGTLRNALQWADTVIVNSEVSSDNSMLYTTWTSAGPNTIVNYCHENNKTAIVMSIDKPYDVQLYTNADAIVACYGNSINITAGIEVILGVHSAHGKLPLDIPVFDNEQGKYIDQILYKRGWGIDYSSLLQPDPTVINQALNTTKGIEISWEEVSDAKNYQLYRDKELIYKGTDLSYLDEDANEDGKIYHYTIQVVNDIGTSDLSEEVTAAYLSSPDLSVKNRLFYNIEVHWDREENTDGYEISISHDSTTETITVLNDSTDHYSFKGDPKTTYTIQIRGYKIVNQQVTYSPESTKKIKSKQFILF